MSYVDLSLLFCFIIIYMFLFYTKKIKILSLDLAISNGNIKYWTDQHEKYGKDNKYW